MIFEKESIKKNTPKVLLELIEKLRIYLEGLKGENGLTLRVSKAELENKTNHEAIKHQSETNHRVFKHQRKKNIIFALALVSIYLQVSPVGKYIEERNYLAILKLIRELLKLIGIL